MLWGWGSVFKLDGASLEGDKLVLKRKHEVNEKGVKTTVTETITVTRDGDSLQLVSVTPKAKGGGEDRAEFTGKRLPPMPPAPDLSQIKFGDPIPLFNGTSLDGWHVVEADAVNGWSAHDGILSNTQKQEEGKPHKKWGNLRTDAEFEDFTLHAEPRLPKEGNSGIYIRGIYEVQVEDSYGKPLDPHNMGAIYSRIKPTVAAEKPAGEWQTVDITFVDRHATVVLNGTKIIDNQPVLDQLAAPFGLGWTVPARFIYRATTLASNTATLCCASGFSNQRTFSSVRRKRVPLSHAHVSQVKGMEAKGQGGRTGA